MLIATDPIISDRERWDHKLILPFPLGLIVPLKTQFKTSYVGQLVHHIFIFQTFGIGSGLSLVFKLCFQTTNLSQNPLLPPPLIQVSMKWHQWKLVYLPVLNILGRMETKCTHPKWIILGKGLLQNNGYHHHCPFQWLIPSKQPCPDFMYFINYLTVAWIHVK